MKIKEFFKNTIDTLKDNRFGWRFKICNIIYNDCLRQDLAFAAIRIKNTSEYIQDYIDRNVNISHFTVQNLNKAHDELFDIFKY